MKPPRTVDITVEGNGRGRILVDGEDISVGVSGVEVDAQASERPEVTLRLRVAQQARYRGVANVDVDAETAAVLRLLGWTPPAADVEDPAKRASRVTEGVVSTLFQQVVYRLINGEDAQPAVSDTRPTGPASDCGHGHVHPRPDGVVARCGGPRLCSKCSVDALQLRADRDQLVHAIRTGATDLEAHGSAEAVASRGV